MIFYYIASFFYCININYFQVNKQLYNLKLLIQYNNSHDHIYISTKRNLEPLISLHYLKYQLENDIQHYREFILKFLGNKQRKEN